MPLVERSVEDWNTNAHPEVLSSMEMQAGDQGNTPNRETMHGQGIMKYGDADRLKIANFSKWMGMEKSTIS